MAKVNLGRVVGKSAYEIWQEDGNVGSEQDFLNSLKGQDGTNGINGQNGTNGQDGKSTYQIWLDNGNTGTEQDFLNSLKGQNGTNGNDGVSPSISVTENQNGAIISVTDGNGTTTAQIRNGSNGQNGANGSNGQDGKSAYQIWLDQGNEGTEQDFLDSLKGEEADTQAIEDEILELRQENQRLKDDLNATTLSVSATGENVTLENTAEARFKKFEIQGNSKQEVGNIIENETVIGTMPSFEYTSEIKNVTGNVNINFCNKNLFPTEKCVSFTSNSTSAWISLDGEKGAYSANFQDKCEAWVYLPAGTYTFSVKTRENANTIQCINENASTLFASNTQRTFTLTEPHYIIPRCKVTDTTQPAYVSIQIEKGEDVTEYVEHKGGYIAFPLLQGQTLCRRSSTEYDYLSDEGIVNILDQTDNTGTNTIENSFTVRQTPIITPYTSEQQSVYNQIKNIIKSYSGQTNIYSTNETSPVFDVEAYKDINSVINDLDSRLSLLE